MNETIANTPHLHGGKGLLPYSVIMAAVSGSVDAMNTVLKHFEGYIAALSTRTMYDGVGPPPVGRRGTAPPTGNQAKQAISIPQSITERLNKKMQS